MNDARDGGDARQAQAATDARQASTAAASAFTAAAAPADERRPLCFVLLPVGRVPCADGVTIDCDAVYRDVVAPALERAGMEPLRADGSVPGGGVDAPALERLVLCAYAVVDLGVFRAECGARVFHALGLREGVRPSRTVRVFADGAGVAPSAAGRLPEPAPEVAPELAPGLAYRLGADGHPSHAAADSAALAALLQAARARGVTRTAYQVVDDFCGLQRLKTDVFRDQVAYDERLKGRLRIAREAGPAAVAAVDAELSALPGGLADAGAAVAVDLLLSYRAVKAWDAMCALVPRLAAPLAATTLVREQLGLALNRAGRPAEAEALLRALIAERGASSETCSLLGRVCKDRWEAAQAAGDGDAARRWLTRAVDAYLQGFESDWRDAFPGINALTLMALAEPPDPRGAALLPVVAYAVERRVAGGHADYWDHASRLELAVLGRDVAAARAALGDALAAQREPWEPESTARNLRLIAAARARRGERMDGLDGWIAALSQRAAG